MERTTKFDVHDLILGQVKLQEGEDGSLFLYVGNRDLHIKPGNAKGKIIGSGSKVGG